MLWATICLCSKSFAILMSFHFDDFYNVVKKIVLLLFFVYDNNLKLKWTGLLIHYSNRFSFCIFYLYASRTLQRTAYSDQL